MRHRLLFFAAGLFLFCFRLPGQSDVTLPLIPYRSGKLWGYARPGGAIVVQPRFTEAGLFSKRLPPDPSNEQDYVSNNVSLYPKMESAVAQVRVGGLYGLLNESGEFLVPAVSLRPLAFFVVDTQLVWVGVLRSQPTEDEGITWTLCLLHKSGRVVVPLGYERTLYDQSECTFREPDRYGNQSIREEPYDCTPWSFYSDYIAVQKNGRWGAIRKDGSSLFPPVWNRIMMPRNDRMLASYIDTASQTNRLERWVLVGPDNRVLKALPKDLEVGNDARYGPLPVRQGNEMGYLKMSGEWAFPERFDLAKPFSKNGFAIVREKSGAWKIIDTTGKKVIDLTDYEGCQPWRDGYYIQLKDNLFYQHDRHFNKTGTLGLEGAPVDLVYRGTLYRAGRLHGKYGLIDEQEQIVMPFRYGYPLNAANSVRFGGEQTSYLLSSDGNAFGVLDTNFREIVPCLYNGIFPAVDGETFMVTTKDGKTGVYSRSGAVIVPAIYDHLKTMQQTKLGWYAVRLDTLYGTYDRDGALHMPVSYRQYLPGFNFQTPFVAIQHMEGWHIYDSTGQLVVRVPSDADYVWNLKKADCDTCFDLIVRKGERRFSIDQNGRPLLPGYQFVHRKGNLLFAEQNGLHGVLSYPELQQIIPIEYEYVLERQGRFLVKKSDWPYARLWDAATHSPRPLPVPFSSMDAFRDGMAVVHRDCQLYGFADSNFHVVIPMIYKAAQGFSEGLAAVRDSGGLWGYIGRDGRWVIGPAFDKAYSFKDGQAFVQYAADRNSAAARSAFIDLQGKVLFEWQHHPSTALRRDGQYLILENAPEPGKMMLVDTRNWKVLLENCDCILTKGRQFIWVKEGRLHSNGDIPETPGIKTEPYPGAGVQFVSLCNLTAMQDLKGNLLVPFGIWSHYEVFPESGVAVIREEGEQGHFNNKIYDLSGRLLQEVADAGVRPLGRHFFIVFRGEQVELHDLKTGDLLVAPGNHRFLPIESLSLVRISDGEGRLTGYCDYEGHCYFRDE